MYCSEKLVPCYDAKYSKGIEIYNENDKSLPQRHIAARTPQLSNSFTKDFEFIKPLPSAVFLENRTSVVLEHTVA